MKKAFLTPFTVLAAAIPGAHASAAAAPLEAKLAPRDAPSVTAAGASISDGKVSVKADGNLFSFVLKRSESGVMVAQHESHSSHASHASHRSHYSSS